MGWNDHLADPDEWEAHVEAQLDGADLFRKRLREQPITCAYEDVDESGGVKDEAA